MNLYEIKNEKKTWFVVASTRGNAISVLDDELIDRGDIVEEETITSIRKVQTVIFGE